MMITTNEEILLHSTSAIQRTNHDRQLCARPIVELGFVQLDADCPAELIEILQFLEISEKRLALVAADAQ